MRNSENGPKNSYNVLCTSAIVLQKNKTNHVDSENDINCTKYLNDVIQARVRCGEEIPLNLLHISNSSISETLDNLATASMILQHEHIINKDKPTHTKPDEGKIIKYGHNVQLFYVYNIPFQRFMIRKRKGVENSANCSVLCQIQNTKNTKSIFKKVYKTLKSEDDTEQLHNTCSVSNQCGRVKDPDKAMERLVNLLTEPMECKCSTKKYKKKKGRVISCHCTEAKTQSRGGQLQRADKKPFYRKQRTNTLKEIWLSQLSSGVTAKTQSRRYGGRIERAGKETFFREIGTSGVPVYKTDTVNPELPLNNGNDECSYYTCDKKTTMNRRIGSNGGCNVKYCNNTSEYTQRNAQSSVYSQLNGINNEGGIFKKLCHMLLEGNNISPVTQKCCRTRGTLCQVDDNAAGGFKKYFQLLIEPKTVTSVSPPGIRSKGLCKCTGDSIDDDEDGTLRKLVQIFQKQIKPDSAGAEATTQSRYYGGRQERAGREIFYRDRSTCGAPKPVSQKPEVEEYNNYEEDIIEEVPICEESPGITNKAVGIGTNCKFSLGWYKDRLGYGEPKPQNLKMAIDEWNEVPLRQTGTKIGASLNADAGFTSYSTNAGTQSRKFRGRHLRAGRETFYKEQQTSCIPKNKKPVIDGNNNVIPQPVQPPPPDRKSLRLGSDCSFCFEFYKDVPPESPENVKSELCDTEYDKTQNKNSIYTKIFPQWLAAQVSERVSHKPNKSDASTYTQEHFEGQKVCGCEESIPKVTKHRKPLHIGSKVSYNFNFSKSISPPRVTSGLKNPCVQSNGQKETETGDEEISSECVPDICDNSQNNNDPEEDDEGDEYVRKTAKEIIKEIFTINTLKRLVKGKPKFEIEDAVENIRVQKGKRLPRDLKTEKIKEKQFACKAKCNQKPKNVKFKTMEETVEKPDQPFRIGSSFSFDYNLHKLMPKQEKRTYEEKFPQLEDFSRSPLKMNIFRLIVGKIRKRVRKKPTSIKLPMPAPRPREKTWFSYILSNLERRRHLATSCETDTKNFFSYLLSDAPSKSSKSSRRESHGLAKRKLRGIGSECFSYVLSNLKKYKRPEKVSTESFFSQMLAKKRNYSRGRRRRRRGRSRAGNPALYGDLDDLYSSIESSRTSRTSGDECEPCGFTSECRFKCDYKTDDSTTDDTQSTASTVNSRNYATT